MKVKDLIKDLIDMEPVDNDIVIRDDQAHILLAENEKLMYNTYKNRTSIYVPNTGEIVNPDTRDRFPNYDIDNTYHTTYKCPHCGCTIHLDWHEQRNFCPTCGTRLIWSEVNKE